MLFFIVWSKIDGDILKRWWKMSVGIRKCGWKFGAVIFSVVDNNYGRLPSISHGFRDKREPFG